MFNTAVGEDGTYGQTKLEVHIIILAFFSNSRPTTVSKPTDGTYLLGIYINMCTGSVHVIVFENSNSILFIAISYIHILYNCTFLYDTHFRINESKLTKGYKTYQPTNNVCSPSVQNIIKFNNVLRKNKKISIPFLKINKSTVPYYTVP